MHWIVALCGATALLACQPQGLPPSGLRDGLELYRQNRVAEAWPNFARAVVQQPKNPETHAWLAEADRRLKRPQEAIASAHAALELEPCHSFAHTVLGDVYTPELPASIPQPDSAWAHYRAAVACDPSDGNARIGLWHEALRRNERGVEDESLGALVTTSFIPSAVLAFNRWVLSSLPSGAILITQGDWDTFPALALQVAEGLRPDVVVANVQLLKHPWYVRRLATRYQLPMPVGDTMALAARVIETWIRSTGEEDQRPLTFAATVDTGIANGISLRDAGAYRLAVSNAGRAEPDTAAMRASLEDLRGSDFTGPHADETDRSAVRWAVDPQLALYVLRTAVRYAGILVNDGRTDEASRVLNWATTFAKDARMTDSQTASLREIREAVSGR